MKLIREEYILLLLAGVVLVLPFAHIKAVMFGVPIYVPEWLVLIAFVLKCRQYQRGTTDLRKAHTVIIAGLMLFLGGALLSSVTHPLTLTGLGLLKSWFFFPFLFGWLAWQELTSVRKREVLLFSWWCMLGLVALRSLFLWISDQMTYDGRLAGDYASPNFLAALLSPAVLISLAAWYELKRRKATVWVATIPLVVLILCVMVLVLTRSYGSWGALFFAVLTFAILYLRRVSKPLMMVIIMSSLALVVSFFWFDFGSEKWQSIVTHDPRSSWSSRLMIWQTALLAAKEHPLLGIGVGRFQEVYLSYQSQFPPYLEWAVPEPHNFFLAVFLSTGMMGLVGMLLLLGRIALFFWRSFPGENDMAVVHLSLISSLWALFLFSGILDTPYFKTDLAYSFFLLLALTLSLQTKSRSGWRAAERSHS